MILDTLAAESRKRVEEARKTVSLAEMRQKAFDMPAGHFGFEDALRKPGLSLICEVKQASPSAGIIADDFPYLDIAREYEAAGARAISVLTEPVFFKGSSRHLSEIRQQAGIPVLRKDFTVDAYQLYEAKIIGADAVLLICALLDIAAIRQYLDICGRLGISALVETHTEQEVAAAVTAGARIIGVNNRDLKTFAVNLETSIVLRRHVPKDILYVAESGIRTADDVARLRQAGVDALLIGESLMRSEDKKAAIDMLMSGRSL